MLDERTVFINGNFIPWNQATIHIMSHSFARASAIFEVISIHDTKPGPAVFRLDEHVERFARSASLLNFNLPFSKEKLHQAVMETIGRNTITQGYIKIVGYLSKVAFGIVPPDNTLDIFICIVDPIKDLDGSPTIFENCCTACLSKWKKLDPQTVPIEAKVSANYLNGMMAKQEAAKRGFDEAIMLDTQGFLAESSISSVFFVKDGRLMTASLGTVLESISRKSILEIAKTLNIDSFVGRLPSELLQEADEIFLSGTILKVYPVKKIEDRQLGNAPGPIAKRLNDTITSILCGGEDRFKHWVFVAGG